MAPAAGAGFRLYLAGGGTSMGPELAGCGSTSRKVTKYYVLQELRNLVPATFYVCMGITSANSTDGHPYDCPNMLASADFYFSVESNTLKYVIATKM